MRNRYNPYSTKNALIIALVISLLQYVLLTTASLLTFDTGNRSVVTNASIVSDVIISFIGSVIMLFVLLKFSFWLAQKDIEPHIKHILVFFGLLAIAVPLSFLSSSIYDIVLSNPYTLMYKVVYKKLMLDIVFAFIVFIITIAIHSIAHGQQLASENMRNRYEALKNQLDPHFLFNSLNTLNGLIGYDDEKAHNYLQNLAQTFRYTIQHKEIQELGDELKLIDSYAYLMKIRYGENLSLHCRVDDRYLTHLILPVSLQLLVENAIKHNAINDEYPLTISIETTDSETIKISNNKTPRFEKDLNCGIGLANLTERYRMIFHKEIKIEETDEVFSVEIPLVELRIEKLEVRRS